MALSPSSPRYDLVNRKGATLCEFYGCRRHTKLRHVYNGLFCNEHRKVLGMLRSNVMPLKMLPVFSKKPMHWVREYGLRFVECLLRKRVDMDHLHYVYNVEVALSKITL